MQAFEPASGVRVHNIDQWTWRAAGRSIKDVPLFKWQKLVTYKATASFKDRQCDKSFSLLLWTSAALTLNDPVSRVSHVSVRGGSWGAVKALQSDGGSHCLSRAPRTERPLEELDQATAVIVPTQKEEINNKIQNTEKERLAALRILFSWITELKLVLGCCHLTLLRVFYLVYHHSSVETETCYFQCSNNQQ